MNMKIMKWMAVLLALVMAASVAQARQRNVPMLMPERVEMKYMNGQAPSLELIRKAILIGCQPYGWVVEQDNPGQMQISYSKQGKHRAVLNITYDATGYLLRYVSSEELYYEQLDGAAPTIHPTYNMWVRNLLARIMIPGEVVPGSAVKAD